MTAPLIKIKVFPKPVLKGKMDVRFPASLSATSPITLNTAGGAYAFGLDLNALLISLSGYFLSSSVHFTDIQGNISVSQFNNGTGANAGTFWCGDGTWKAVSGAVTSFNSRTGAVSPTAGDYKYADSTLSLPTKYWSGLTHSNNVTTPNTKIDIAAGSSRDSTDTLNIVNSAGTIDCGTVGANGLDAGALAATTWYYTFAISTAGGTTAFLASTSPTAPTLPATYTKFRRIGSFRTNASSQILAFTQVNDRWYFNTSIKDNNGTIVTTTPSLLTLSVPRVQGILAIINLFYVHPSVASSGVGIRPGFAPTAALSTDGYSLLQQVANTGAANSFTIPVDSSARISIASDQAANGSISLWTTGWEDNL